MHRDENQPEGSTSILQCEGDVRTGGVRQSAVKSEELDRRSPSIGCKKGR